MYYPGYHSPSEALGINLAHPERQDRLMEGGSETVTITEFLAMVRVPRPSLKPFWLEPRITEEAG